MDLTLILFFYKPMSTPVSTFSITNGGSSELLLAADATRQNLFIQPQTEDCLIQFGQTAGTQATGTLTAGANASNNETVAINGTTFTAKSSGPTGNQFLIGATKEITMTNLAAVLNSSVVAGIALATYTVNGAIITITYDAGGTDGNAYTLADSSGGHITRSGATLSGGSNTVGGMALALNQIATLSGADFPSIREAIYVLSATDAAKIGYLSSQGA